MRVINVYTEFSHQGGAQNVALQLASQLNERQPIVLSYTPSEHVCAQYCDKGIDFRIWGYGTVKTLADGDTVFLSHHRKLTTLLMLYKLFLGRKLRVVHVAHSVFDNLKFFCLFPRINIAVSSTVRKNLIEYFGLEEKRVKVIYNGLLDRLPTSNSSREADGKIRVLHLGRLCAVKGQLQIVQRTLGRLNSNIHLDFAGSGEDEMQLRVLVEGNEQYRYIGQVNVHSTLPHYDYVLLFSEKEGLPLSLIEASMYGKPMITNDISTVQEVNVRGETGYVCRDYEELIDCLNNLPARDSLEYAKLSCNARKRYETMFKEEEMIRQYKEILFKECYE